MPFIRSTIGPVERAVEWCAGPGFIGFSLFAHGLCQRLDLIDVNPEAVEVAARTIRTNGLQDRVTVFLSDCFDRVREDRTWDLVVGNPPHANVASPETDWQRALPPLIYMDTGWDIHRRFYASVARRLRTGGSVVIQENAQLSRCEDFKEMIEQGGLELAGCHVAPEPFADYYFVHARLPGPSPPGPSRRAAGFKPWSRDRPPSETSAERPTRPGGPGRQ